MLAKAHIEAGMRLAGRLALAAGALLACEADASCALSAAGHERWYTEDSLLAREYESMVSAIAEFECDYRAPDGANAIGAKIFARGTQHDSARNYVDIRELVWTFTREPLQLRAGIDQVFWGVTEFSHVVDVINQSDVLDDVIGDLKIGQPMVSLSTRQDWGTVTLFGMPRFRDRIYPDVGEPMRAAPPLELGPAQFESRRGRNHFDWALRYSLASGPMDLGLSYFEGTNRDPKLITVYDAAGNSIEAYNYYQLISQYGFDMQLTLGDWLVKLEGAQRNGAGRTDGAWSAGLEYAISGVSGTPADVNVVLEFVRDKRELPPVPGFLQDDWSVGMRVALNDVRTTVATVGLIFDRHLNSQAWAIELSSRVAAQWRLAMEAKLLFNVPNPDALRWIRDDSFIDVSVTRYF